MFSQRRSFPARKLLFPVLIVLLLSFGYWVNQSGDGEIGPEASAGSAAETVRPQPAEGRDPVSTGEGGISLGSGEGQDPATAEDPGAAGSSHYLLKEAGGIVSLYYCTAAGEQSYIRDTEIAFALLSQEDQDLFLQGLQVPSEAALDEILQDFES